MSDIPDGFKMTEIGMVPDEWSIVQLGQLLRLVKVKVKDIGSKGDSVPLLSIARYDGLILQEEKFSKRIAGKDISNYQIVKKDQIVVGFPIDEGVIYALKERDIGAVSPAYKVWELYSDMASIDYLDILLKTQRLINVYRSLSATTVRRRRTVNSADFVKIQVALPPFPEQKKIAAVLSTVQEAKEKTEAVIQAARELKKSLMKHLFTYGPVSPEDAEDVPLRETEIGMVPEEWKVVKVGDATSVQGGYAFKSSDYTPNGVPLFRISNVSFGKAVWGDTVFLPTVYTSEYSDYILKPGDLVMAMTRPIVSAGIKITRLSENDTPCLLNQRVCRFNPKDNIDLRYLFQMLFDRSFVSSISDGALGSQQPNISAKKIENIPIPYPKLPIQQQIAGILSAADLKIEAEENKKKALEELFKTLLSNLMTGLIHNMRGQVYTKGRNVRGIRESDGHQCHLIKDDSVVSGSHHYPCVIYMREGGKAVGEIGKDMRSQRMEWSESHNTFDDPICRANCLDVCIDYNNKAESFVKE